MSVSENDCRVCLEKIPKKIRVVNLFEGWSVPWDGMGDTIAEDLNKFASIQVEQSDSYSTIICRTCCNKLKASCKFQALVKKNDSYLQKCLQNNIQLNISSESTWPKPILLDNSIVGNFHDSVQVEVKQEIISDDEQTREVNNQLDNVEIKIEPEEFAYNNINDALVVDSTRTDNCTDVEYLDPPSMKTEATSEDEAGLSLDCLLCSKRFNCISGLKAHVIVHHSYKSVKRKGGAGASPPRKRRRASHVCATCKRAFDTSTDLMVHETCHDKLACYVCNSKYDTFDELSSHRGKCVPRAPAAPAAPAAPSPSTKEEKRTSPPKEEAIKYECKKCSEHFTDPYYLNIHEALSHAASSPPAETSTEKNDLAVDTEGNDRLLNDLNETVDVTKANVDENNTSQCVEGQGDSDKNIEEDDSKIMTEYDDDVNTCRKGEMESQDMSIEAEETPTELSKQEVDNSTNDHTTEKLLSLLDYCEEEWSNCKETERLANNNIPMVIECHQDYSAEDKNQILADSELNKDPDGIHVDEMFSHLEDNLTNAKEKTVGNSLEYLTNRVPATPFNDSEMDKHEIEGTVQACIGTDSEKISEETNKSNGGLEIQSAEIILNVSCPNDHMSTDDETNQLAVTSNPGTADEVPDDLDSLLRII